MLKLFKPRQRKILGIDISASSIKILQLSSVGEKHFVEGYGSATLPKEAMEGNTIKDVDLVANSIKSLLLKEKLSCKQAAIAVPDSATISKIIQINEGLKEDEMEEVVIMEADKYIPYPIDEINFDFNVLGPSTKNTAMMDVLIVASRAENVSNRVEVISRAGLSSKIVDVESYAVERVAQLMVSELPAEGASKTIAIIDIGAEYTHFFFLYNMQVIFVREEEFGGRALIESIMQRYNMTSDEAYTALEQNTLPDDYQSEVMKPFHEQLFLEVKRGLQFFFSTSNHNHLDYILLAGGVAKHPGLAEKLQSNINIPTQVADPIRHMECDTTVNRDRLLADSPKLLVASGLALRAWIN